MKLSQFQHSFADLLFDHPDALKAPDEALAALFAPKDIALHERLGVYRNNVVGSLTTVLVKNFPLLEALVGEAFLRSMARDFALKNPPEDGCLNHYGRGFDAFISTFKPAEKLPYLADMARLELATNDAYYAADDAALTAQDLGSVAPENLGDLVLMLRASVQVIDSAYPLMDIRAMCLSPDDTPPVNMQQSVRLMVHRPRFDVVYTPLEDDEYMMLGVLQGGTPLGAAVEAVLAVHPAFDFQTFLQKHLALETFRAL